MSQGSFGFTSRDLFELTRVNRALSQLARPVSNDVDSGCNDSLRAIEQLWSLKRELLREAGFDQWSPAPSVA